MLLTGTYPRTLDDKKRLAFPKKVRDQLHNPSQLYLAPGPDQALCIYTHDAMERLSEKSRQLPANDEEVRVYRRLLFGQTESVDMDRNGRVLIPERLLQFAALQHDVVLLGVEDHLELWDAQRWQEYERANLPRFDSVAERAYRNPD